MSKINLQLHIVLQQQKIRFRMLLAYFQLQLNKQYSIKHYSSLFQTHQDLFQFLQAFITLNIAQIVCLSKIRIVLSFGVNMKESKRNKCKFWLINQLITLIFRNCLFLTSLSIFFRDQAFYQDQQISDQTQITNQQGIKSLKLDALQFKFLKRLTLDNQLLNLAELKSLTAKNYQYLKRLQLSNQKISNLGFYYLSKANWPNLVALILYINGGTADGIKILQKYAYYRLQEMGFRAEIGSQLTRKLLKIDNLLKLEIVPQISLPFQQMQQPEWLLNMKRSIFMKELVKSGLFKKYVNCRSVCDIKYSIMVDGRFICL